MTPAAAWIWTITLAIVSVVVVPLALYLLHRTLRAARSIERYTRDALTAGVGIAGNTAAIAALQDTINGATSLLEATEILKQRTAEIAAAVGAER